MLFMSCVFMPLRLFIAALWSPAGKGLTSWLLFVMFNCVFVTFPCNFLGQVWYLLVSNHDICCLSYFTLKSCMLQFCCSIGPDSGIHIGCYADDPHDHDLSYEPFTDPKVGMWPPMCMHHCFNHGYLYAGVQVTFKLNSTK